MARKLAELSQASPPQEACLAGLVHDIGRLVLDGLGPRYDRSFRALRGRGAGAIDLEWTLCGSSHASMGGLLLEDWHFPSDFAEAVRHHHTPIVSNLPLSSILYLAESWNDILEDVYHPAEHAFARACLGISIENIQTCCGLQDADLKSLQFAA